VPGIEPGSNPYKGLALPLSYTPSGPRRQPSLDRRQRWSARSLLLGASVTPVSEPCQNECAPWFAFIPAAISLSRAVLGPCMSLSPRALNEPLPRATSCRFHGGRVRSIGPLLSSDTRRGLKLTGAPDVLRRLRCSMRPARARSLRSRRRST
jgi:hypothetical protein